VRFSRGAVYSPAFYVLTLTVMLLCALEPAILRELSELDERADQQAPSLLGVVARPLAYLFGLLLFLIFDEHNSQFIYSQF